MIRGLFSNVLFFGVLFLALPVYLLVTNNPIVRYHALQNKVVTRGFVTQVDYTDEYQFEYKYYFNTANGIVNGENSATGEIPDYLTKIDKPIEMMVIYRPSEPSESNVIKLGTLKPQWQVMVAEYWLVIAYLLVALIVYIKIIKQDITTYKTDNK